MSMSVEIEDVEKLIVQAEENLVAKLEGVGFSKRIAWGLLMVEHTEWARRTGRTLEYHDWKSHYSACSAWANFVNDIADNIRPIE